MRRDVKRTAQGRGGRREVRASGQVAAAIDHSYSRIGTVNSDPDYASLVPADLPRRPIVLFDCWRVLRETFNGAPGVTYIPLGVGLATDQPPMTTGAPQDGRAVRAKRGPISWPPARPR